MCGFTVTNKGDFDVGHVDYFTRLRGPDETIVTEINGITIVHHLLWLTGRRTPQPFVNNDKICVFNGEIYNYKEFGEFETDGECLLPLFEEYGEEFTQHLDGEYAIVIIDLKSERIHFFRDIFATKPCYYSFDDSYFAISSYASSLKRLGFSKWNVPPRATHEFSLAQYKESYDDWIDAFERAVSKRIPSKPFFIGLSSGYDSGAIDVALKKLGEEYTAITVGNEYLEGRESIKIPLPEPTAVEISHVDLEFNFPIQKNIATAGQVVLFQTAREMDLKVCLSGQGADEVMWDYNINRIATSEQTLGKNFFDNRQTWYLGQEERVAGAHGIESRYPFLDPEVVQEYLWLKPEPKNRYFKAPIHEYLTRNNYPFVPDVKIGFGMGIKNEKVDVSKR